MAKVAAPLFSFRASGKLADAIVYFPWKGIQAVRQYVIPANPKTEAQKAQRAHMTAAVAEWHGAAYSTLDRSAWRVYSGVLPKIMAGFNAMVKVFVLEKIKNNVWERIHTVFHHTFTPTTFRVQCWKVAGGNTPTVHYGVSKLYMPGTKAMDDVGGDQWVGDLTGLIANTGYFYYIDCGTSGANYGRTGIYYHRTPAA